MAELVHKVLQDATQRSTTSTSLVEITEYTISWSALTTAGFANGDNVAIIVWLKSCTGNISTYARASLRVGSTFAGSTELPGCLADTESPTTSSTTFPPILFIDDYTLVTDDNIYLAMATSNGTYAVNADDFSIVILNRDDLTSTNYQYAETTPSGNAATTPTDGAQLSLTAGDWLVFAMTQWLDDSTSAAKAMDIYVTGLGASLATDNFNGTEGTELAAYNSTWVQHGFSTTTAEIAANRIRHTADGRALYYYNTAPSSPDYSISADLYVASLHASEAAGICGRINASASTFYQFIYEYGTTWRLYRVVAGTPISIASYAQVLTAGNTYAMKMEIIGNSISCYVDGVLRIHAADANIEPTAGFAGVRIGYTSGATPSDSTLYHLDNFEVVDSNARGYVRGEGEDTQDTDNHGSMTYLSLSGSKTTTVRYWTDTASTHDCVKTKLMGIRMDAFADFWGTASKNLLQPAAASTYYEYANNNTFSLGQTGNVLSFGFFSSACVNGSPRCNGRVTLGGSAWPDADINTYLLTSNGPAIGLVRTPCIDTGYASVSSGTKDYGWEYKEEGSLTNQRIYEQAAVVFSLELASAGSAIDIDFNSYVEWGSKFNTDALINAEYRQQQYSDMNLLLEHGQGVRSDSELMIETRGQHNVDHTISVEHRAILNSDSALHAEWLQAIITDQTILVETLHSIISDGVVNVEYLQAINVDEVFNIEWGGGVAVIFDANIPVEWRGTINAEQNINAENRATIFYDALAQIEHVHGINAEHLYNIESLHTINSDGIMPAEYRGAINSDHILNAAWSGVLIVDSVLHAEFSQSLSIDHNLIVEHLKSIGMDVEILPEWGSIIIVDRLIPIEWQGILTFYADNPYSFKMDKSRGSLLLINVRDKTFKIADRGSVFNVDKRIN